MEKDQKPDTILPNLVHSLDAKQINDMKKSLSTKCPACGQERGHKLFCVMWLD